MGEHHRIRRHHDRDVPLLQADRFRSGGSDGQHAGRVIGVAGLALAVYGTFGNRRTGLGSSHLPTEETIQAAKKALGRLVAEQWRQESKIRSLSDPHPIPISWRLTDEAGLMDHPHVIGPEPLTFTASSGRIPELAAAFRALHRRIARQIGLVFGLVDVLLVGLLLGLVVGLVVGIAVGLVVGPLSKGRCAWLVFTIVIRKLSRGGRLPRDLMVFLDDAHRLGLLRTVGPIYQFRHADLQDHLATLPRSFDQLTLPELVADTSPS
ncbi:hypothetical protein AB0395_36835 [Streptosporangium sp. NPDC051023]|uniref:hypothetical protein n=1 Tax=Streptosporangium sp. NPDC051023 TaxID=3155410 RepID=UPI00344D5CE3